MGAWFIKSQDIFILIFALVTSSIEQWSTYVMFTISMFFVYILISEKNDTAIFS